MTGDGGQASAGPAWHRTPAPAPGPADVGIVAALPIEVGPLVDQMTDVRQYSGPRHKVIEGEFADQLLTVIIGGTGRAAARRATQILLDGHRPLWVLSAGFAGALDPDLRRNDVVVPVEALDTEGGRFRIDPDVPLQDARPGRRIRSGRLLTVDQIIRTADAKAELRQRYQADVVDMETSAVAAVCAERAVRFLAVRVVSDEAQIDLPPEILSVLGRSGGYRLGAALGALWRRPSSIKELWNLREHAMEAADRLVEILPVILAQRA